jgi:hypothetical protein
VLGAVRSRRDEGQADGGLRDRQAAGARLTGSPGRTSSCRDVLRKLSNATLETERCSVETSHMVGVHETEAPHLLHPMDLR